MIRTFGTLGNGCLEIKAGDILQLGDILNESFSEDCDAAQLGYTYIYDLEWGLWRKVEFSLQESCNFDFDFVPEDLSDYDVQQIENFYNLWCEIKFVSDLTDLPVEVG